ncbi:MAG TPA: hypothetical protein VLF18_22380 [Tahibacter sp.]|uniref:hypothetical protein n=1 Tax=Tahibacter sp. TaxID=2056211 RepID=UPI002BF2FE65|nr:hypothetical protein [Tahibacter sp.]HSX62942.1 hypothetical protein [Tahibacter sp.]
MSLRLTMLPARQGDALWIEWGERPWRMLVDMGTQAVGTALRRRIAALPREQRRFELLVVTHVDEDHVGGTLPALVDEGPIDGLEFGDTWFNGWPHLQDLPVRSTLAALGPVQGERLGRWLRAYPWNAAFDKAPVAWQPGLPLRRHELADGLRLSVLGPPPTRLPAYRETWRRDVAEATATGRLEPEPATSPSPQIQPLGVRRRPKRPALATPDDLAALADTVSDADPSLANGTSIVLLLDYRGHRVLLAGDAWSDDLVAAIRAIGDGQRLSLSAFKLPHHASESNVSRTLVEAVDCRDWLISTDGTRHYHPGAAAVARVLRYGTPAPRLHFNVRSEFNGWWDDADWRARFGYETRYGDATDGLALAWP